MISLCVFSKNRPMQLDTFLKSLKTNAKYINDINVLYTYENNEFKEGYDILQQEHLDVKFHLEQDLHNQILDLVKSFQDYFLWATDDSIFYKKSELTKDKLDWVFSRAIALNLRMGLNIEWQNHWFGEKSSPIVIEEKYDDLITWNAENYNVNTDVGRVWQNDASIMPTKMYLERLLVEDQWKRGRGVRELDNTGSCGRMFKPCFCAAFIESVYLNVPVNLVHLLNDGRLYADNWGKYIQYDINYLNRLFLDGKRIDWQNLDYSNINCGRKELKYIIN